MDLLKLSNASVGQMSKAFKIKLKDKKHLKRLLKKLLGKKKVTKLNNGVYLLRGKSKTKKNVPGSTGGSKMGRLKLKRGQYFVQMARVPGRKPEFYNISSENLNGALPGQQVVIEPQKNHRGAAKEAVIIASVGGGDSFQEVSNRFLKENKLKVEFSNKVLKEIKSSEQVLTGFNKGRKDLRRDMVVTIDPLGARDHDDAISLIQSAKNGWILTVHIADVSQFVPKNSFMDKEALKRSFTNYLPWMAVPMLPEKLSNDLCSLKENQDRLALSCRINLNSNFDVTRFTFFESLINVNAFFTYEEAQKNLQTGHSFFKIFAQFARGLKKKREKEGVMEFQFPEPKVLLDEEGEPKSVILEERVEAYQWIEECMLLANQCTAKYMTNNHIPGLYRVHETPEFSEAQDLIYLEDIQELLGNKRFNPSKLGSPDGIRNFYLKLLFNGKLNGKKTLSPNLQRTILRTMKKAQYSENGLGHFALGWKHYAHFTSPIRRYADLWNHRYIKHFIKMGRVGKNEKREAREVGEQISGEELDVQKRERRGIKSATAWILRDYLGQEFQGTISGFDGYGIYVLIQNEIIYGEGWVSLSKLKDDYYEYNEQEMKIVGKRRKKVYKLEDKVKIRVEATDPVSSKVDFDFVK